MWKVDDDNENIMRVTFRGETALEKRALDYTQSLSLLVHSNWETGAIERHSRAENGEEGRNFLFPILRAVVYLARGCASRSPQSLN